jgi:LCP family protein required for cell wall assembly
MASRSSGVRGGVTALVVAALTAAVLSGAGILYARAKLNGIAVADVGDVLTPAGHTIASSGQRLQQADLGPTAIENYLLVGSDSRAGADPSSSDFGAIGSTNQVGGQRSDTIMVLRYDPTSRSGAILSFPRDLWVPMYGITAKDKLNAAFNSGPKQLIQTIEQDFGVPIHHYVQVDFDGFKALVDAIGGVSLYFDVPSRDTNTKFEVDAPGCVQLDGEQALAFARSRYWQTFTNGHWTNDPGSDLDRIKRQQQFLRQALTKALADAATSPTSATSLLDALITNVTVDQQLANDLFGLANRLRTLGAGSLQGWTLPADGGWVGNQQVLFPRDTDAQPLLDYFRGAGPPPSPTTTAAGGPGHAVPLPPTPPPTTTTTDPAAACH